MESYYSQSYQESKPLGKKEEIEKLKNQAAIAKQLADTSKSEYKRKNWRRIEAELKERARKLS